MVDLAPEIRSRTFLSQLFTFRGRSSRTNFWISLLVISIAYSVVLTAIVLFYFDGRPEPDPAGVAMMLLNLFVSVALVTFAAIRRLHDRGNSGHRLWLFYVVPAVASLAGFVFQQWGGDRVVVLAITLLGLPFGLWALVEIGFLRGTPGPNRFGPNPLASNQSG